MSRRIADNAIPISTPLDISFFQAWLDFTIPIHGLTPKERKTLACYLLKDYELSTKVVDDEYRAVTLMSPKVKQEILQMSGLNSSGLTVMLSKFRAKGVMVNGVIDPKLVPALTPEVIESEEFRLMVKFSIQK